VTLKKNPGGLVAFYDIRPANEAGLFLQPSSWHGASLTSVKSCVTRLRLNRIALLTVFVWTLEKFWKCLNLKLKKTSRPGESGKKPRS